ncbi:MAG: hypothetical protein JW876_00750 [Candidatus Krumholzibacteriota bacterium]|nr:hypothetical protein [Candidatus Krumholzibacteriota bacterium]
MSCGTDHEGTIGIIVTHGTLGRELLRTAELIVGRSAGLYAISGSDLCNEEVVGRIRRIAGECTGARIVVFVDYFGGSCCINSMRAAEKMPGTTVVSGVNLPLLLDFLTKKDSMEFDRMIEHILGRGKESIRRVELQMGGGDG